MFPRLNGILVKKVVTLSTNNTAIQSLFHSNTVTTKVVRTMATVTFSSENAKGDCPGYLQGDPANTSKGLIVLQEWWGSNDQIKAEAKLIGDQGNFVTLVPDLYRGQVATDNEQADHLMKNLDWPGAVKDIRGAAKLLISKGCKKVGVTGFCMGGALSLAAAALGPEISATAPFYGIPGTQLCDVATIKIPVQAHFGTEDPLKGFSSPEDAKTLAEKLKDNKDFELFMYEGCAHAFTNPTGPLGNYNEAACKLAFERLVAFMNKHLE